MSRPLQRFARVLVGVGLLALVGSSLSLPARGDVTREQVERAIRDGVAHLKGEQAADGSWTDVVQTANTGTTSLVTLALLTAGEPPTEPHVARALEFLEGSTAKDLGRVYAVALQTMVFAAANPDRYRVRISANVYWLEHAQIKPQDRREWPGSWSYTDNHEQPGDNSNSQYALLALHAASEVGVPVKPEVWALARQYWERAQHQDGGWSYQLDDGKGASGSMTCAGLSSLIITGLRRYQGQESLVGENIQNCGKGGMSPRILRGTEWLGAHFRVSENIGKGQQWKYYYLYGLERAGRLTGQRFFADKDWYREGAEHLVRAQQVGAWRGVDHPETDSTLSTSFALLFLAKGRAPVLVNKLRHNAETHDWNQDPDDIRNLVAHVSKDWKHLLTWQVVDPGAADVEDLLQAPILFFNGHEAPNFSKKAKANLREYVEQGGFLVADACCNSPAFDRGFRELMVELFPEPEYELHPLSAEHPVWRARWPLSPEIHPLLGIEHGCRTVVVYSPKDLSCFWNQSENQPENPAVMKAQRIGQNIVDYATGRELPADKLSVREVKNFKKESAPKRGALHIAKLHHAGDWNVAPLAIPNLTTALKERRKFDVVINHRELLPRDPNLVHYPLIYVHGRAALSFPAEDMAILRKHLEPGGGTLFADAACGSTAFDVSFRKFVADLLPETKLEPIPADDEIYTEKVGYDLSDVQFSKAAGGAKGRPRLEGVKLNGHWAILYSPYDIGCALERQQGLDCKGYTHESAMRIAANIVLYATLP